MKTTLLLKIKNVGTGTDATIGMLDGNLIWASNDEYSGWTGGIIDQNSVSGVSNSINIVNGGGLGGLEGTLTISAINPALHAPLIDGTISIIGKNIEIYVTDGVVNSCRYSGKVSTWELQDEATIEIISDPMTALDLLKIPTITIDNGMALGLSGSEANGKTIEKVYGNICDFPLIYVPSESIYTSAMLTPSYSTYVDGLATRLDAGDQMFDGNGNFRAINIMQVLGKYQESETENVKICLSVNGRPMFTDSSSSIADYVKKQLMGSAIKVISGTGDGNVYNIIDANFETHTLGDVATETIWFTINTNDISAITEASGSEFTPSIDDVTNHVYFNVYQSGSSISSRDTRFRAPYDHGKIVANVSHVQIIGVSNIFIVSSDIDLTSDMTLIGSIDGKEIIVSSSGCVVLFSTENWKMIRINISDSVLSDQNNLVVYNKESVETRVLEEPDNAYSPSNCFFSSLTYYDFIKPHSQLDGALVANTTNAATFASGEYYPHDATLKTLHSIEIDSVMSDLDLSDSDLVVSIVPDISFSLKPSQSGLSTIKMTINISAVNNANLVVSNKQITRKWTGGAYSTEYISYNLLWINTDAEEIAFPFCMATLVNSGSSAYQSLLNDCDITDLLKCSSNGDIRYLVISTSINVDTGLLVPGDISADCASIVKPFALYTSKKVSKENLYLRATKVQSTNYDILCPSDIIRQLADETGEITIDNTAFDSVQSYQRNMLTDIFFYGPIYKGQIIPSSGDTISEIFDKIGKQTMTAFYTEANNTDTGIVKLRAKWFSDTETPTYTIQPSEIVKGSFSVSKPDGGMIFTDYNFKFTKTAFGTTDSLSVNTDEASTFPDSDYIETYGSIYGATTGYTIDTIDKYADTNIVRVLDTTSDNIILSKFNVGTKWKLFDIYDNAVIATITHISYEFSKYLEMGKSCNIAFKYDRIDFDPLYYEVSSFQSIGNHYKWQDCVTGNSAANYTDAKNIWEYAKASRLKLGLNRAMPSEYTTISDPIWGSDSRALRQFSLYVTKWNAREKTVVKLSVPMTSEMLGLKLLQYIEVSYGVFASIPISGYIVDMADDYSNATISLTILCPKDADSLLTILNENYASADLTIDERNPAVITDSFNEGLLA